MPDSIAASPWLFCCRDLRRLLHRTPTAAPPQSTVEEAGAFDACAFRATTAVASGRRIGPGLAWPGYGAVAILL